jgi:hypothetical protein
MELDNDTFQVIWRNIPALVMVLAMLLRLEKENRGQRRLAKNFNFHTTDNYLVHSLSS